MNEILATISVYAIPVIFAITLHEAAHAYAAKFFGDTTAYSQGRMSMNPIVHIDIFGTIIIPAVLYIATGGQFLFGYAKPVPVNFGNLRNPKRDMAWVALAGPAANFVMAYMWLLLGLILQATGSQLEFFYRVVEAGVLANLLLLAFNLLPIPPLDGGRVLVSLLPHKWAYKVSQLEPYGFMIVIALVIFKVLQIWIVPVMTLTHTVLLILLTPFKLILGLA